jgi:hypothetical protein
VHRDRRPAPQGEIISSQQGVAAVYNRHTYDKEKRAALLKWEKALARIVAGPRRAEVIPSRGRSEPMSPDRPEVGNCANVAWLSGEVCAGRIIEAPSPLAPNKRSRRAPENSKGPAARRIPRGQPHSSVWIISHLSVATPKNRPPR